MKDVLIAVPTIDRPIPERLKDSLSNTKRDIEKTFNLRQEVARTELISKMFNGGYEYLFFIDSDMSPHMHLDDLIDKFKSYSSYVVSALTTTRGKTCKLLLFRKNPNISYPYLDEDLYKKNKLINVYAIGFGACLIHKSVFEKIGYPWIKTGWEYVIPETDEVRLVGGENMGADFWFSMRCNQEKIPMHIDCSEIVHHQEMEKSCTWFKREFPDEIKMEEIERRNLASV